ncbi:MAG: cytidylate kinase family protein [Eggerthellaceae bacterium]
MGFLKDMHERRIAAAQEVRAGQPVVITIARDYGAEGHEIGKMLSMELGIPLYDNELLVRSAARNGEVDKVAATTSVWLPSSWRSCPIAQIRAPFPTACSNRWPR